MIIIRKENQKKYRKNAIYDFKKLIKIIQLLNYKKSKNFTKIKSII